MRRLSRALWRFGARPLHEAVLLAVVVFMLLPSVIVLLLSFSGEEFIRFPPRIWGLRQYETLISSAEWLTPLRRSVTTGSIVALVSVVVGGCATIALTRSRIPGRNIIQVLGLGPLLTPAIAYAISIYALFARLRLIDTQAGLVIAHTLLALPFVLLILGSAINRVPQELELAAMSLGARRWEAYRDVTLPLLAPALIASGIFAFITSFDEVVIASFLSGSTYTTLPKAIFDSIRYGVDAVITAIASVLTLVTAALLGVAAALRRRSA